MAASLLKGPAGSLANDRRQPRLAWTRWIAPNYYNNNYDTTISNLAPDFRISGVSNTSPATYYDEDGGLGTTKTGAFGSAVTPGIIPRTAGITSSIYAMLTSTNDCTIVIDNDVGINTATSTTKRTVCFWMRPAGTSTTDLQCIYEEGGGTHGWGIYQVQDDIIFSVTQDSVERLRLVVDQVLGINVTCHVAVTFDFADQSGNSNVFMYVDGVIECAGRYSYAASMPSHSGDIQLFGVSDTRATPTTDTNWAGRLQDWCYWTERVLTPQEIAEINAAGRLSVTEPINFFGDRNTLNNIVDNQTVGASSTNDTTVVLVNLHWHDTNSNCDSRFITITLDGIGFSETTDTIANGATTSRYGVRMYFSEATYGDRYSTSNVFSWSDPSDTPETMWMMGIHWPYDTSSASTDTATGSGGSTMSLDVQAGDLFVAAAVGFAGGTPFSVAEGISVKEHRSTLLFDDYLHPLAPNNYRGRVIAGTATSTDTISFSGSGLYAGLVLRPTAGPFY